MTATPVRRALQRGVDDALTRRSFHRRGRSELYVNDEVLAGALQAHVLVSVESDRYGRVRVAGAAEVVAPAVEALLETAPSSALTRTQEVNRGGLAFALARSSFDTLDGQGRQAPLEWTAEDVEQVPPALEEIERYLDGPVMDWFRERADPEHLRTLVVQDEASRQRGSLLRAVAAWDALHGRLDRAVDDLDRYGSSQLSASDSPERVQAFVDWLRARPEAS